MPPYSPVPPPGANSPGSISPMLQQMLGGYNVDPNQGPSAFGDWANVSGSSQVYTGQQEAGSWVNDNFHGTKQWVANGQMTAGYKTVDEMMTQFWGEWAKDPSKISDLGNKFVQAGWISLGQQNNTDAVGKAYEQLLLMTAKMHASGSDVTPMDALGQMMPGGRFGKPQSYDMTDTVTNYTDPQQARAMLVQTLQDKIGRNPTAAEYNAFLGAIHQAEQDSPTVTHRTYTLNPDTGLYKVSNSTQSGGMDAQSYAQNYAVQQNPIEAGSYQAGTTYFNALMQALHAVV